MRGVPVALLGGMAALVLSNCSTEMCACPPTPVPAQVTGRVLPDDNTAVPGARVRAYSAPVSGCISLGTDFGLSEAAADGSFHMWLPTLAEQDNVCVLVFALPPDSLQWAESLGYHAGDPGLSPG